ncbi:MAG: Ni/Fe hydrogenase subunit gamma [wastewater metagenome]|nr:Ni/Fe hydrogenase subunit gamma [Candidatus Loosdrechtia aerotolerans]
MINNIPEPMTPNVFRINKKYKETHDTFTIELEPTQGTDEFFFSPGQFNMLYVFGVGEAPISISGDPKNPKTLKHTIRVVGTVTKAMYRLKRGEVLGVRGPFGSHWPSENAVGKDVIIIAGGIGLAPLRPVVYQLISQREKYRKVVLLYGARTPEDILYTYDLEQWQRRFDIEIKITVDAAAENWRGDVGVVTTLIRKISFDPSHMIGMICGPEIMMRFTVAELQNCGVGKENIFLSMERNMRCGIGFCGHCQFGPVFVCKEGPVFNYECIENFFGTREI